VLDRTTDQPTPAVDTDAPDADVASAVTEGEDAQGEALVTVECEGRTYRGSSVSTNIVESGVRAFLEVINRIELSRQSGRRPRRAAVGAPGRRHQAGNQKGEVRK